MSLDDLRPGLRHSQSITVAEAMAVPALSRMFVGATDMPPVFATASMIAFVEWTCVAALAPYLTPQQRTVGTRIEMTHAAATPIGMTVTAEIELVEIAGSRLRFKAVCRDEVDVIGEGCHERHVIDHARFMVRLAGKQRPG